MTGRATTRRTFRIVATCGAGLAAGLTAVALVAGCGPANGGSQGGPANGGSPLSACKTTTYGMPKVTWGIPTPNPRGVVILLPGGGWQSNPAGYRQQVEYARAIASGGVATVAVEYGPGASGFRQVEDVYEKARRCFPDTPICALGDSAGGNLALMLATKEPDLACVIARAAPTDLTSLAAQGARATQQLAVNAFGERGLAQFSPVRRAASIKAPVMLIMAQNDPLVPAAQGTELKRALPDAQLIVLPPGPVPFVHGLGVTPSSLQQANRHEIAFLERATPVN